MAPGDTNISFTTTKGRLQGDKHPGLKISYSSLFQESRDKYCVVSIMEDYLAKKLASNDALIPVLIPKVKMSDWLNTVYFYIQYPQRIKEIIRDKTRREVLACYDDGEGMMDIYSLYINLSYFRTMPPMWR